MGPEPIAIALQRLLYGLAHVAPLGNAPGGRALLDGIEYQLRHPFA
jgi:hypothetical protein